MRITTVAALLLALAGCGGGGSGGPREAGDECVSGAVCAERDLLLECTPDATSSRGARYTPRLCSDACRVEGSVMGLLVTCERWFEPCDDAGPAFECRGDHLFECVPMSTGEGSAWLWRHWCGAGCEAGVGTPGCR